MTLSVRQDTMDLDDIFPNLHLSRDDVKTLYDNDLKPGYTRTRFIKMVIVVQDD